MYCGVDIIEVSRIEIAINKHGEKFLNEVFTDNEIKYCESKNNMRFQHFAARFAAKEAVFKAVSPLVEDKYELSWKDIEIINDESGRPFVVIEKLQDVRIDISLSHLKDYAIANCIVYR